MKKIIKKIKKKTARFYYLKLRKNKVEYARFLGVRVGNHCQILADPVSAFGTEPWLISLGDHVDVTSDVHFLSHEGAMWCARWKDEKYKTEDLFLPTKVGNNVMIGRGSLIMPGVCIGNDVVIGGNSVVTKDIPDGVIVAGMPAKQISTLELFMEKLKNRETFTTKNMTTEQKKSFLMNKHPEWFI